VSVPESDVSVRSTASCSKKAVLVRTPCNGLHGSSMITEFYQGFVRMHVPDHELVVIAS